ncbi:MAG TPA: PilZ domain-containing protein [Nitrospiraceae bacterium]|nr:PilZ domain-containing protein [Nitrospiraceae bacterium]
MSSTGETITPDERREWLRIEDRLLLSYRVQGDTEETEAASAASNIERSLATFIVKPTADLLAHAELVTAESSLVPWLMKIDWLLNLILTTLANMKPEAVALPELTEVTLSAGGLAFETKQPIEIGDMLSISLVLPPFTPVHAMAAVVAVAPLKTDASSRRVSVEFTAIEPDDRERLIRHILHIQAERLRARRLGG